MRSTTSVRTFSNGAFETFLIFICLAMTLLSSFQRRLSSTSFFHASFLVCRGVHRVTDLEKFQFESPISSSSHDHFYIALFSALEQTHCALVACDSEWVTVAFYVEVALLSDHGLGGWVGGGGAWEHWGAGVSRGQEAGWREGRERSSGE